MAKSIVFKAKRGKKKELPLPFPIPFEVDEPVSHVAAGRTDFEGTFNGNCVAVDDADSISALYFQGYFGKGNLSRSEPTFNAADRETEVKEISHLSLEEAYFLSYALGCLQVKHEGQFLDLDEMWTLYSNSKKDFVPRYVAYHHFRSCGWVVRSGIKFGNDFLLYKTGPDFYHASYSVRVIPVRSKRNSVNDLSWIEFSGISRITESTSKELLLCYVTFPSTDADIHSPASLKHFKVNEVAWKRWVASQHEGEPGSQSMNENPPK